MVTGATDGNHTVVTTGLSAGDKVVIDGVDRLRDGAKVKVVDQAAAESGQAGAGAAPEAGGDGSAKGAGQHHHRRHDQSGTAQDSAPPAQTNPAPRTDAAAQGPAQGEASSTVPAPASPTSQGAPPSGSSHGAATPQPTAGGAPAQGPAR